MVEHAVTAGGNFIATYAERRGQAGQLRRYREPSAAEVERQARMAAGTW